MQIKALSEIQRGVALLSGTTSNGKSTTLAAVTGEINRHHRRRIITIEDPIEYVFEDKQSLISQREVGLDTLNFTNALKHVLRQDPEVILLVKCAIVSAFEQHCSRRKRPSRDVHPPREFCGRGNHAHAGYISR